MHLKLLVWFVNLVNRDWFLLVSGRIKVIHDRLFLKRFELLFCRFSKILWILQNLKIVFWRIIAVLASVRVKKIIVRIDIRDIDFFDQREFILMKEIVNLRLFGFSGLGGSFWVLAEGRSEFVWLVAVHVCGNVDLILSERFGEMGVCFNMRTLNNRRLHLQLNQMFPMLLIITLIMGHHMVLLHKHLSCTLDPLVPGHNFLRSYDLRSFGQLDDVVRFGDYAFRVIIPWFLSNDLDLLLLQRLIRGLFSR